jgi:hypothetical protein
MRMSTLKPQDLFVVLALADRAAETRSYAEWGERLGLSASEVHAAVRRARAAGLLRGDGRRRIVNRAALLEFLEHGVRFVFVPERGGMTRGIPTSHAAPPLDALIAAGGEPPPVWPSATGTTRGLAFEPLYRSVPDAAARDPALYQRLALVDALRAGSARERALAAELLPEALGGG